MLEEAGTRHDGGEGWDKWREGRRSIRKPAGTSRKMLTKEKVMLRDSANMNNNEV